MKLYNSLSKQLEEFTPQNKNEVKMYVCGITPYDTTHVGHAFTYIFFDVLSRYLEFSGYKVTYTQNVTDINDRDKDILERAREQGIAWQYLANYWTDRFLEDMHTLNWKMPDHYLWASAHIPAMLDLIKKLLDNNFAYISKNGVFLDIGKIKDFGKLSGLNEKEMLQKALEFEEDTDNPSKRNALDITLWRPTEPDQPLHIPSFESPYGPGRPGWHLECSAMATCSLGEQIDIHGGGADLIYPHHESEIAQSEAATAKIPFSTFWLHTQLVSYKGSKISKSKGNLIMVSKLLEKYSANAIRFLLLSHHYREPWEFQEEELEEAERIVERIKHHLTSSKSLNEYSNSTENTLILFKESLDDDMNTPKALEIMTNTEIQEAIKQMSEVLGFKF
jgi:L-cysteine:1D-myo-inositol 2-amino-2-deoxy-alpha-D-glucopyranoside ligase